jgi:hypothetical protein
MNEEPNSFWSRPRKGAMAFRFWFTLLASSSFLVVFVVAFLCRVKQGVLPPLLAVVIVAIILALLAFGILFSIHWLRCWSNFRRFLIGLACFATLIMLGYVVEHVRGKWGWEKFKREWEAKGERFTFASLAPPPVPDDQNFAMTPIVASCYSSTLDKNGHVLRPKNTNVVDRLTMVTTHNDVSSPKGGIGDWQKATMSDLKAWQQYYRELAVKTNEFPVALQPQSPAADVLLALSKYDLAIEEVRQAGRLPASRFPLTYDSETYVDVFLPHLRALKKCSQVLQLRALAELQTAQSDQALADVKLALRLAESMRAEPFLISHLVRIAIVKLALQPVWEGLVERKWSDAQLAELNRELAKLDFVPDYTLAMRGEMAGDSTLADFLRRNPEQISAIGSGEDEPFPVGSPIFLGYLIPSGWFYQNQLHCARIMVQYYLPAADLNRGTISPAPIAGAEARIDADSSNRSPYNVLQKIMLPALGAAARKFASGQSFVDLARVACALERYRPARGEHPASLDALAPQFIAKLPLDIIGRQPLKYRRTDDGQFVLYSVGWNEKDDGGEVALNKSGQSVNIAEGDWVWRYPAN